MTSPLPERIAVAINELTQAIAGDHSPKEKRECRETLIALFTEVVAERDATRADLSAVMQLAVDKWLDDENGNAATRAARAREVALKAIEAECARADGLAAELAAAQAKLAEVDRKRQTLADIAVESAGWLAGLAGRPSCSCDPGDLVERLLAIAAAEQGGAL